MLSLVMVCLLLVLLVSVPLPLTADASAFHIYPKASISNIDPNSSSNERVDRASSETHRRHPPTAKRSTMLLNKLMHALHKALDNEKAEVDNDTPDVVPIMADNYPMDLHRRGEDRMTRYWRCYFNAVSCF